MISVRYTFVARGLELELYEYIVSEYIYIYIEDILDERSILS